MVQLLLFPPPATPGAPLPSKVRSEAKNLLASLLIVVTEGKKRESQEKKQMLFPITIAPFEEVKHWKKFDADRGTDSAREIREYYIPDFSRWESDNAAYQKEFEKLVAALKAGGNL